MNLSDPYVILSADNLPQLADRVNAAFEQGYLPTGSVFTDQWGDTQTIVTFYQALFCHTLKCTAYPYARKNPLQHTENLSQCMCIPCLKSAYDNLPLHIRNILTPQGFKSALELAITRY